MLWYELLDLSKGFEKLRISSKKGMIHPHKKRGHYLSSISYLEGKESLVKNLVSKNTWCHGRCKENRMHIRLVGGDRRNLLTLALVLGDKLQLCF